MTKPSCTNASSTTTIMISAMIKIVWFFVYVTTSYKDVSVLAQTSLLAGSIYINEVASTPTAGICGSFDWVELINTSGSSIDLLDTILADDAGPIHVNAYNFTTSYVLTSGEIRVICGQSATGNDTTKFRFAIGGADTITLYDSSLLVISTTGLLTSGATTIATLQRTPTNTYRYATLTQGTANTVVEPSQVASPLAGTIFINEVANVPTAGICSDDWIELINVGGLTVDMTNATMTDSNGPTHPDTYTFPATYTLTAGQIRVICGQPNTATDPTKFKFGIGSSDTITLYDSSGFVISTTGLLSSSATTGTFQRTSSNTWVYGTLSQGKANTVKAAPVPVPAPLYIPVPVTVPIPIVQPATVPVDIPAPAQIPIPLPVPVNAPLTIPVPESIPVSPIASPMTVPIVVAPVPIPISAPLPAAPQQAPTAPNTGPVLAPFKIPVTVPTVNVPVPIVPPVTSPVILPPPTPTIPAPVPVNITQPVQNATAPLSTPHIPTILSPVVPVRAPTGPNTTPSSPIPLSSPVVTSPITAPITTPVVTSPIALPVMTTPVSLPVNVPIASVPVPVPTIVNIPTLVGEDCGLFRFNFFCPRRGKCGFWRRLFNIGGC